MLFSEFRISDFLLFLAFLGLAVFIVTMYLIKWRHRPDPKIRIYVLLWVVVCAIEIFVRLSSLLNRTDYLQP